MDRDPPSGSAGAADTRCAVHTCLVAMSLWGSAGSMTVWGLSPSLEVGGKVDIAAEVISISSDAVLVAVLPHRTQAKILGTLDVPADCSTISVFDATMVQKDPLPVFIVDDPSDVLL